MQFKTIQWFQQTRLVYLLFFFFSNSADYEHEVTHDSLQNR